MENYTPKNNRGDKDPTEGDESNTSKKKKKKSGIFPLPIETEKAKPAEATEKPKKLADLFETKESTDSKEASDDDSVEEGPEVEVSTEETSPYLGELVIDHSSGAIELPTPEVADEAEPAADVSEFPELLSIDKSEQAPEQAPDEAEQVISQELPVYTEVETPPASPVYEQPPAVPPETAPSGASFGELFNPAEREYAAPIEAQEPEEVISTKEANRRALRAEKRGLSRGVASGGLAGWWLGRRSGRRQGEPRHQAEIQKQTNEIKRIQSEQTRLEQTVKYRESVLNRTIDQLRGVVDRTVHRDVSSKTESSPVRELKSTPIEQLTWSHTSVEKKPEQPKPPVEQTEVTEAMYTAPEGHRYETSAWHRIEVDEKSGRLVERPSQAYGEAFQQEQQQERLARDAATSQTAAQVASLLAASQSQQPVAPAPVQPVHQPATQKRSFISAADTEFVKQQLVRQTTNPYIWGIAVLILLFLIAIGVL